ncbi:MAG: PAS domain-containing sensor histidine kinase [Burkholderiales bacterium]
MPALTAGGLTTVFAPIVVLLAVTAMFLVVALLVPSAAGELMLAAGGAAIAAGVTAMVLLYRQTRRWQRADLGMRDAESHASELLESAMDPIVTVDAAQRIVAFNSAAEAVFRWPREAAVGQPLDMLIPSRFHDAHRDHIDRFAATGVTSRRMGAQAVLTARRADGAEFPIEASISQHAQGDRKLFTVILRDVSERVRAEALLARSEARLRGILDSAMDAIITIDESQHIVLFNAAAEAMFACPQSEAIGAPIAGFIPERFRGAHGERVRAYGDGASGARRMGGSRIVSGLRRTGEEFPIDASISQVADGGHRFYTVILRDISERVKAHEALRRSKEELQELSSTAHIAREQEKARIARELHDELGQALTMLQMDVAWCKARTPAESADFAARLERMERLLKSTVAATRRIAADLRPLMLDDLGLAPAVEWLVENFTQRTGVPCALAIADADLELPSLQSNAVFRIVQEALTNVAKHASATRAEVSIGRDGDRLVVRVRDDGVGFAAQGPRKPNSFGLVGLRERAALLRGEAAITTGHGAGTTIEVRLPVVPAEVAP